MANNKGRNSQQGDRTESIGNKHGTTQTGSKNSGGRSAAKDDAKKTNDRKSRGSRWFDFKPEFIYMIELLKPNAKAYATLDPV